MTEPRTEAFLDMTKGVIRMGRNVDGVLRRNVLSLQIAIGRVLHSASKFPFRHPRLHGLFLELRSFLHRILLVWRQGGTRPLEMGLVYQASDDQKSFHVNTRTQARIRDTQELLKRFPWCSGEDCQIFLLGWDSGSEWRGYADTSSKNVDRQHSPDLLCEGSAKGAGNPMPRLAVRK